MKRIYWLLSLVLAAAGIAVVSVSALTADMTNWLGAEAVSVEKTADLAASDLTAAKAVNSLGIDCIPMTFPVGVTNAGALVSGCGFSTALGTVAKDYLVQGPNGTLRLDTTYSGTLRATPVGASYFLTGKMPASWSFGEMLRIGSRATLPTNPTYLDGQRSYQYTIPVDITLSADTQDGGKPFAFVPESHAFSRNGKWMVAMLVGGGIIRYDTNNWTYKVIAWDKDTSRVALDNGNNLAISDDGRFIAHNPEVVISGVKTPMLKVYDARTCRGQYGYMTDPGKGQPCEFRDIWNGTFRGQALGQALKTVLPGVEFPRHLRFDSDNAVIFDSIYNRVSTTSFSVGRYRASTIAADPAPISLLGMGDSYISGEGAYYYRPGTDTKINGCHTSWLSYPYMRGAPLWPVVKSVACSGATMYDIDAGIHNEEEREKTRGAYTGQVKTEEKWGERSTGDQDKIITQFIPGYANQAIFSDMYKPRKILLSIGGNDIHFADILKSCVSPTSAETCYQYYEDRYELMQSIVNQYDNLVKTYKLVAGSSQGTVYVVGYPQIAVVPTNGQRCTRNVQLSEPEIRFSNLLITYLNDVIERATKEAGVVYVDIESALSGSRLCETEWSNTAVNGITIGERSLVASESYHPNALGHKLIGQAVVAKTDNFTIKPATPRLLGKPTILSTDALLQNTPKMKRDAYEDIQWRGREGFPPPLLQRGSKFQLNGDQVDFQQGSGYYVVLRSRPVLLYEGYFEVGQPAPIIEIPADTVPGYHTVHVYGTGASGRKTDIRQLVYVTANSEDYNGDNTPNAANSCLIVSQSGVDEDSDGVDDACDGGYSDESVLPEGVGDIVQEPAFDEPITEPSVLTQASLLIALPPVPTPPSEEQTVSTPPAAQTDVLSSTTLPPSAPHTPTQVAAAFAGTGTVPLGGLYAPVFDENIAVLGAAEINPIPLSAKKADTIKQVRSADLERNRGRSGVRFLWLTLPVVVIAIAWRRKQNRT
ncbi:MAG: GDSL-type esterase/lipase family protein [Candidatus Saccharimonadales bacterium]